MIANEWNINMDHYQGTNVYLVFEFENEKTKNVSMKCLSFQFRGEKTGQIICEKICLVETFGINEIHHQRTKFSIDKLAMIRAIYLMDTTHTPVFVFHFSLMNFPSSSSS